jgi:hypothetical protein
MNVTDQFQEVGIFLADYGLITILEKVALPFMPFVEIYGITRKESAHAPGQGFFSHLGKNMKMIGKQGPGVNSQGPRANQFIQTSNKVFAVFPARENGTSFDPPSHDMM